MSETKTITFALMDPPFESSRVTTAMRLMDSAARKGCHLKVFCYEGAVFLPFALQKAHPNAVHGRDVDEEAHPLSHVWVRELMTTATQQGGSVEWINCGLCVDERGAGESIEGVKRGTPGDLVHMAEISDNTIVIPTR